MRAVVVTAEPFGAYHLVPLVDAASAAGLEVSHLLPYSSPPQGAAFPTVSDMGALDADVLVVTGGMFTPWSEAVAHRANTLGVPTVFVELAYAAETDVERSLPSVAAVAAVRPASADLYRRYLGGGVPVTVVGAPQLDDLPNWAPHPRSALALTTVSAETPDAGSALLSACGRLRKAGWAVTVRCHPREPQERWAEFVLDRSASPSAAAATAAVAVGYAGTAIGPVVAVGCPFVALETEPWMSNRVPDEHRAVTATCTDLDDLVAMADAAVPADSVAVLDLCGPVGGAAERLWALVAEAAGSGRRG